MRLGDGSSSGATSFSYTEYSYTAKEAPLWFGRDGTLEAYKRVCVMWKLGLDKELQKPEATTQIASLMVGRWVKKAGSDPKHLRLIRTFKPTELAKTGEKYL